MDEALRHELELKAKILSALDAQWQGGEQALHYAPNEDAQATVDHAKEGILRVGKTTMGEDALLTLEVVIPNLGLAANAQSGQGAPIRQADKYFGYLRALADKADIELTDCGNRPIETENADTDFSVSKHDYHFRSSSEGLSFESKIQMRVHPEDVEKLHTALKQELGELQNQLAPLGKVPHESIKHAFADGRVEEAQIQR